jgi:hypothetical protein
VNRDTVETLNMIQTVEGVFRNGKVELLESPQGIHAARVIVTFLPGAVGPEGEPSFTPEEIADLRGKLAAWEDDWNAPGMEAYDDYETRRRGSGPISLQ